MNNLITDILVFIVQSLGGAYMLFVLLRFMLQMTRADFYNPFSQAIVKITNPTLIPLRKVIPGIFGIDIASIVLILLVQLIVGELMALIIMGQPLINPTPLLVWGALGAMNVTIYIFYACIFILVISSFVAPYSSHPILILVRQLTDPIIRPIRQLIPPVSGLDFSVFFVGMALFIVQKILAAVAYSIPLEPLGGIVFIIGF